MTTAAALTNTGPPLAYAATLDSTYKPMLRGVYVGTTGDVSVMNHVGSTVVFKAVPAGGTIRGQFQQILSASTASDMVALQ